MIKPFLSANDNHFSWPKQRSSRQFAVVKMGFMHLPAVQLKNLKTYQHQITSSLIPLYCLSLRGGSRHLANICSWLLSSAIWLCCHHLSALPLSLNAGIPGTCVWNNRGRWFSTRKSARSPGIKEQRNTATEGRRMMVENTETSLKLRILPHRCWYIPLRSVWWMVSTSSCLFYMNKLSRKQSVKAGC